MLRVTLETRRQLLFSFLLLLFLVPSTPLAAAAPRTPTPEEFAGFRMGTEKKLLRWEKIVEYFHLVDRASDRIRVEELGKTTLGNPFLLAIISAPENLERLAEFQRMQRQLAYPYDLDEAAADELIARNKVVLLITLNIHSTEIGSSQMALELIHRLATDDSPSVSNILDNVIFLLVPSFNPDGQIMVVDWYNQNLDTEFALSSMPWLYHPYTGHDNNRDAFMLTQAESRLVTKVLYQDWFPQVYLDEHQMGPSGPRIFVPPFRNPINPNVDPTIWAMNGLLGFAMNAALHDAGFTGITYDQFYTSWWQGGFLMEAWWHNIVGLLTEVATTRMATPIEQEKAPVGRLERGPAPSFREFLDEVEKNPSQPIPAPRDTVPRANYPNPWLGGRWTLRDIIDYELVATTSLLEAVASNRLSLMKNQYRMGHRAIEAGQKGDPYAYVFPPDQHDPPALTQLLEVLAFAGVEVHRAEKSFTADGKDYPAGSTVILMAQPFRAYAKDLLEVQKHPDPEKMPAGAMADRPYDVTGWTLPLQMGVRAIEVKKTFEAELTKLDTIPRPQGNLRATTRNGSRGFVIAPGPNSKVRLTNRLLRVGAEVSWLNEAVEIKGGWRYPAGSLYVRGIKTDQLRPLMVELALEGEEVKPADESVRRLSRMRLGAPRVGLYQPWTASMDEGWTRWLLEQYEFPYTTLHNADLKSGKLNEMFDVLIFPGDRDKREIVEGDQRKWTRPDYKGGIGEEGMAAVREFVRTGGTLVLMDQSVELALEAFALPVKNSLRGLKSEQFSCPGSLLRILVDTRHPIAYGMPTEASAVFINSTALDLAPGFSYTDVKVIARYPSTNPLQSGWLRGPEHLQDQIAAAEVTYEKGRLILIGFRPQFRAQPHNTFKLLFNALHYAAAAPASLPSR